MKASELISILKKIDNDAEVTFQFDNNQFEDFDIRVIHHIKLKKQNIFDRIKDFFRFK